ncbi:retrovirus-related pol polyprotein from transposon TNT 1-94 [Tanacetum coccineum]
MSFIKRVENQNDIHVKQLRTDNGTEFRNSILINFRDKNGISQNISSPYTPKQNDIVERKNRTLIEAARTMLSGSVFSKQYSTEINQSERGISIYQENYVKDLLKKHEINGSSMKTPMVPPNNLGPDLNGKAVNET